MKRLTTLLLAAGLVCSAFSAANAADIKAKGMWDFNFEYTNDSFDKHSSGDRFGAAQRLRTQIDVIASESLKGVVYFEIGDTHWGHAKDGASLGTDGRTVEVRYSYIDWAIPETDVLVRMGLQPFVMPGFVAGSAVLCGMTLFVLPLSFIADKTSKKKAVTLMSGLWGTGCLLCGLVSNFFLILLGRFMVGMGNARYAPVSVSMLTSWTRKSGRGSVIGMSNIN